MITRTIITLFFLIGFLLNTVACSQKTEVTQTTLYVRGTLGEITIYDPDKNKAKKAWIIRLSIVAIRILYKGMPSG